MVKVNLSLWFVMRLLAAVPLEQPFPSFLAHPPCCCSALSNMLRFCGFRITTTRQTVLLRKNQQFCKENGISHVEMRKSSSKWFGSN